MSQKNDLFLSRICKIEISGEGIEFDIYGTLKWRHSLSRLSSIQEFVTAHSEQMSDAFCHVAATDCETSL
jgi:hypothetical protein